MDSRNTYVILFAISLIPSALFDFKDLSEIFGIGYF